MRCLYAFPAVALLVASAVAAQTPSPAPAVDLGEREQGRAYPVSLVAQNLNCRTPQDFRFDLRNAPLIVAGEDPVARQVQAGGEKSIPAQLVLFNAPVGEHISVVTTTCETCRPSRIFGNNCRADKSQIMIRVMIVPPPSPPAAPQSDPQSPAPAGEGAVARDETGALRAPPAPALGPPEGSLCPAGMNEADFFRAGQIRISPGADAYLGGAQKGALNAARAAAQAAAGRARAEGEKLNELRKKKRDCDDELAALRARQAEAETAAAAAQKAADSAQKAVDRGAEKKAAADAQRAVDNFQKDVDKAQADFARWTEAAQRQQNYLEIVIAEEGGLSSQRGRNAQKYYDDAARKREDARNELARVTQSMAARQAALAAALQALAAAQAEADAMKFEAARARAEAEAAKEAADAKARECLGLNDAIKEQEKAASAAERSARDADAAARRAEDLAARQARENVANALSCKRSDCDRIKRKWNEHFRRLTNAQKALEQIGYYKQGAQAEGSAPIVASAAQTTPDGLWKDYLKLGLDKFLEMASSVARERLWPGRYVPGSGLNMALDILQAAYGVAGIYQSALLPGTYAHGRTEGASLRSWLQKNNFAHVDRGDADAREVEKQMERLMKDPGVMAKDLERAIREMEKCKEEIAALEAQLASM